jgi:uncharacterized protein YecT (DUF1311 family)
MKKVKSALPILVLLLIGHAAHADEKDLSKQFSTCMDKSEGVNSAMSDCIEQEFKRQDARLNKNYKALAGTLTADRKKQLQTAQRAWIQYRDANCAFYLDPEGGKQARIDAGSCTMSMTAARASELERLNQ